MDAVSEWALILGILFIGIALASAYIKTLPLTTAIIYLVAGLGLGPLGLKVLAIDPVTDQTWIERIAQIAICIALFSAGLKLRANISDEVWRPSFRLSTLSVAAAVLLGALAGVLLLHLPWGMAFVLAAILVPTDPVLAADVELEHPSKTDRLRFTFTGEAALNDCTAAPFLALGLGLSEAGHRDFSAIHWAFQDLLLSSLGGILAGALVGASVGLLTRKIRRRGIAGKGFADFVVLGLIAFSFGCGLLLHVNGFLAVFSSAVALRQVEMKAAGHCAEMEHASLQFAERIGHLGELAVVLILGALITPGIFQFPAILFTAVVFVVIRPISVWLGLLGSASTVWERGYLSWFGVRGAASLYYLMDAQRTIAAQGASSTLFNVTLVALVTSILIHGVTVTPLMRLHAARESRLRAT